MLGTQGLILFCILVVIVVNCNVGSNTSHITIEGKNVTSSGTALTVVSEAEVLHGSHFEARKRRFSIGKFNVTIKQNWRNLGLGCVVWPAAILLSKLFCDRQEPTLFHIDVRDKFVVELGTGTGLPSIIAALNGARNSIATDRKEILEHCTKKNIASVSNEEGNIDAQILDWDSYSSATFTQDHGNPDIIIGADLIYHESGFKPLIETLLGLSWTHTKIVIAGKERYKELNDTFLNLLKQFTVTKFDSSHLGELVSDERDYVYILEKNESRCDI